MKANLEYQNMFTYGVLKISGRIDASNSIEVEKEIFKLLETNKLLLDLSDLDFIDSSGLVVLITLHGWIQEKGGLMVASNLNDNVRMVFEITRATELVKVYCNNSIAIDEIGVSA